MNCDWGQWWHFKCSGKAFFWNPIFCIELTLTLNWNWNRSFHDEWWIAATSGSKVIFMMWMWNCGCTTWSAPHLNWNLFLPTVAAMVLCASSRRTGNPACLHNAHHLLVQCAIQRLVLIEELRSNMPGMTKLAGIALNTTASGIRMSNIFLNPDLFFARQCMLRHDNFAGWTCPS